MSQTKDSTKPSADACRANVYARYEALQRALRTPKVAPSEVLDACASQVTLAQLDFPNYGISPMARNSMYKYADEVLAEYKVPDGNKADESGRHYLDWLRKQVLEKALSETGYRTKAARQKRATARKQERKDKLTATEEAMLACSKAYWHLFQSVRSLARIDNIDPATRDRLFNLINHHDEVYADVFAESPNEARPDNVEQLFS